MGCDRAWEAAGSGHTLWSLLQLLGGILQHRFRRPGFNNFTHSLTTRGRNPNDNHCDGASTLQGSAGGPLRASGAQLPLVACAPRLPPCSRDTPNSS